MEPIATDEYPVVRRQVRGIHRGGFPGAPEEAIGDEVAFTGTGTLRVADGRSADWANADSLLLVRQLAIRELPGS